MFVPLQDVDSPEMMLGDEIYDDPADLLETLPERVLLCDFVESYDDIAEAVKGVRQRESPS